MNQIILTTPEELRAIVSESVSQTLAGNKLLFSRRELLSWAESLARRVNDKGEAALAIARSANRKLRSHGK